MQTRNWIVGLGLAASMGLAGLTVAGTVGSNGSSSVVNLDDETPEIQHLRAARKHLNNAKDDFERDAVRKGGHRQEILDGIDHAVTSIDTEIGELEKIHH